MGGKCRQFLVGMVGGEERRHGIEGRPGSQTASLARGP